MTHTFDIRFARTAGLTALLEAPGNRYRWKGGGLLRIDAKSVSFTVKRSLLALLAGNRTQRIPAENLREVYREGEALRVEFLSGETSRVVLPFWANDRDAAAQIVRLLPTRQTVEIEHSTGAQSGKPRADKRALLIIGLGLAAFVAGIWTLYARTEVLVPPPPAINPSTAIESSVVPPETGVTASPVESRAPPAAPVLATPSRYPAARRVEQPAFPIDLSSLAVTSKPSNDDALEYSDSSATMSFDANGVPVVRMRSRTDGIVPIVPGDPTYEAARRQLDLFLAESSTLRAYYHEARYSGNMQRLGEIGGLWWKVTVRVSNSWDFDDPALLVAADQEVEFAEMLQARAAGFVN